VQYCSRAPDHCRLRLTRRGGGGCLLYSPWNGLLLCSSGGRGGWTIQDDLAGCHLVAVFNILDCCMAQYHKPVVVACASSLAQPVSDLAELFTDMQEWS
jgi:hypothetical protein